MPDKKTEIFRKSYTGSSFDIYPNTPLEGTFITHNVPDSGGPLVLVRFGESLRYDSSWFKHVNYNQCALEMILEGEMEYLSDGERHVVTPGQIFLIVPGSNVRYCRTGDSKRLHKIHLLFSGPLAGVLLYTLGFTRDTHLKGLPCREFEDQIRLIGRLAEEKTPAALMESSVEIYRLLLTLSTFANSASPSNGVESLIRFQDRQLRLVCTNSDLEMRLNRGHSTLNKLYRKHTGLPPHRYHRNKRLALAAELLRTTELPVKDIAAECGFADSKYFLVVFKKLYGLPPGKYRSSQSSPENAPGSTKKAGKA